MRAPVLALLLLACACAPPAPALVCAVDGARFEVEDPASCGAALEDPCALWRERVRDARTTLEALVPPDEVQVLLQGRAVRVHAERPGEHFNCAGTPAAAGCYVPGSGDVHLNATGGSLVHELLHAYQEERLGDVEGSATHRAWGGVNGLGWSEAGQRYAARAMCG